MADDVKRCEQVCVKVTERMYIDLGREAAIEDRSVAELIFTVLRSELYGRSVRHKPADPEIQTIARNSEGQ